MIKKLRVGYFGDGIWAHNALVHLLDRNDINIAFIAPRSDLKDAVLCEMAKQANVPIEFFESVNTSDSLQRIKDYKPDLLISMSFNQIIKKNILDIPPLGFINCHAGKLPEYRGRNILNWALINDEQEFGITVHYIDEGIDTGDIILQKCFPITDQDDYKSLLEKAHVECASLLNEAVTLIWEKRVKPIAQQSLGEGFYCGKRGPGDEVINWNQSSREIFNFVRALTPPAVGASTFMQEAEFKVYKTLLNPRLRAYIGKPGQILGKSLDGWVVKTKDTYLTVQSISPLGARGSNVKLRVGQCFNEGGGYQ